MSYSAFVVFTQHYFSTLLSDIGEVYCNQPVPRDPKLRIYKIPSRTNFSTEMLNLMTAGNDRIMISPEVIGEAELVDILFEPYPNCSSTSLGLLGELLFVPSIIESMRWSPTESDIRTCMSHWLGWKSEADGGIIPVDETSTYEEKDDNDNYEEIVDKILLIIVPSIQSKQLTGWGMKPSARNISGVYELPPAFCTTIVVTNELPKNEYTLWLRILGRGPNQRAAIQELMRLDTNYHKRELILTVLKQWHQILLEGNLGKESKYFMQVLSSIEI
ncbi:MAG: hypothetical protein WCD18_11080 [Thermosynechococcaceae cyanobacterium]